MRYPVSGVSTTARPRLARTVAAALKGLDWRETALLAALAVLLVFLWDSWLLYPLRILVVFFHEMSHGLAALLTGGGIRAIHLHPEAGGMCVTTGGIPFLVISAGYLGSLVWGGALMLLSRKSRWANPLTAGLGIFLLAAAAVLVREVFGFGFLFCAGAGAALAAMGLRLPAWVNAFVLRLIGLASCMYAIVDIKADILDRSHPATDATLLAGRTGIPAWVWGLFWMVLALAISGVLLVAACARTVPAPNAGKK